MPRLCAIPGDGIGQEVVPAAVTVLRAVVPDLEVVEAEAGWACFHERGVSVPPETLDSLRQCRSGLFGAVSSPSGYVQGYRSAILTIRQSLDLYASIRPIRSIPRLSPRPGVDMIIVRENSEGLYVGREHQDGDTVVAERLITRSASRRIATIALELCEKLQRQELTIVHKANVLPLSDGLFRETVRETVESYGKKLELSELLVDAAALKIVEDPFQFDVLVTTNLFGDILSDVAAYWGGGLGVTPSLNWGDICAVAEPVHGSAPDIAGSGKANPAAAILSGALLVRHVWGLDEAAARLETAVSRAFSRNNGLQGTMCIIEAIMKEL